METQFFDVVAVPESQTEFTDPIRLPFTATSIIIANDCKNSDLHYSFQPPKLHGILNSDDGPLVMDCVSRSQIWFKQADPNEGEDIAARVWAWRGGSGR